MVMAKAVPAFACREGERVEVDGTYVNESLSGHRGRARVKLAYTGDEIRADRTLETILADGAGAMSRVKLAWSDVRSQYDALFAANTNPHVPSDRLVLWTRCRAWLQYEGYSHEINADCIESFRPDPAGRFAEWTFRVPCGMGQTARFAFTLALAPNGGNAAQLAVRRLAVADAQARVPPVRIVFRPDLEWRSFHAVTKAQGAVEQAFGAPGAIRDLDGRAGFAFCRLSSPQFMRLFIWWDFPCLL